MFKYELNPSSHYKTMSSGERKIEKVFDAYGIPFEYERPLLVKDKGKQRIWYPDFSLNTYGVLVEYYGITKQPDYLRGIDYRLNVYKANHYDVVDMYPTSFQPGWEDRMLSRIENVLESRVTQLINSRYQLASSKQGIRRNYSRVSYK